MAKNKKTVKQQMKYWWVGRGHKIKIKARTARTALRKYLRGNLLHDILVCELELDNPLNPNSCFPSEVDIKTKKRWKKYVNDYIQYITVEEVSN